MSPLALVVPSLTVLLATILAVLPWGVPVDQYPLARFLLPALPFMVIHFWLARRPAAMPPLVQFLAGLLIDIVTRGPLGLWPLVFLTASVATFYTRPLIERGWLAQWAGYAAVALVLVAVQWAIASGYYLRGLDPWPMLQAAAVTVALYPLLASLLAPLAGGRRAAENPSLTRRT